MRLRIFKRLVFAAVASLPLMADAQTLTITNGVQKFAALTSTTVNMSGRCELWLTSSATPLSGCTINLNSTDAWLFLPGVKPSVVASTYLGQVRVSGAAAVADSNVRVVQYGQNGAVVIPHASSFQPLTVFTEPQFGGTSNKFSQWNYYTGSGIGSFSSFKLKRGYQVVFAQSSDGKNWSKCYVAQDGDLEIGVLPSSLDKKVQFIYVTPWRWVCKKGIAGDPGISRLNVNSWYNWNINSSSSRDLEYVAIRHNGGWPPLNQNWQSLGINTLLGYNEPDQANQANLSVAAAISSWGDLLATGLRVGSPGCSDGGPNSWLIPFLSQADAAGLRVDFVAQHYYQSHNPADPAGCASQMYNFLLNIWNNTHRPVWVTEWNNGANWTDAQWPVPTYAQQQACVSAMINMLEATPFVERYQLYNWVEDGRSLIDSTGTVTPAGVTYSNLVSALSYSQAMPDNGTRSIAQFLFATNTLDSSGYCNNALAASAPAFTNGHNSQVQSIILDGANNYVQLPANIAKSSGFTFAAWIYWNGGANWQRIFDFGNDTSHYLLLTPSSGGGTLRFAINNGGGEQIVERAGALASGSWQHVAITLNGSTALIYVNGAQVASSTSFTIVPSNFSPTKNYLGKSQFPDPLFSGKLDEVEIADFAMTPAQISALFNNVQSPVPPYTSGVWTQNANGNWGVSNNWSGGAIAAGGNGVNYSADFSTLNISADTTVTLDSARSIGGLKLSDTSGAQNWFLTGGNTLTLDTGSTNSPTIAVNQNTATLSTPLGGNNGFTKSGGGTLVLAGTNSLIGTVYADSGSASANDGILRVTSPNAMSGAGSVQIRDNISGSSTLQLDGTVGNIGIASVALSGRNNSVPAIENLAGTNTLFAGLALNGNGNYFVQSDAGALNLDGIISGSSSGASALTLLGGGNLNVSGSITDGAGGPTTLIKNGSGSLSLSGASANTGGTVVNQGTLVLQPSPAMPVLHLTFNNTAGSGNGSVITNTGSGGSAMNGVIVGSGASIVSGGRFGNALSLNGTGGNAATNIVLISNKVFSTDVSNSWTAGFWIKTATAGAVILYQGDGTWSGSGQTTYLLNANSGSTAGAKAGAVRWAGGFLTGTAALNNNVWHFITLVDNGGTESIYVDGNVDAITSSMGLPLAAGANQLWIGGAPDTDAGAVKMNGLIDEVYMFSRALSQTEVQSLYANNAVTNVPASVLPVSAPMSVAAGGTLDLVGSPLTVGALSGGGLVTNSGATATLTVSNSITPSLFSGNISDAPTGSAVNFTKSGSGTFVLAGTNSYHGSTTVSGGTLKLSTVADDSILHLTFNNAAGSGNGSVITNTGLGGATFNGSLVSIGGASIVSGGRFGNALNLNGSGGNAANNIVLINSKVLNTDAVGTWSVGCWIKTTTAGAVIMYQGDGTWSSSGQTTFYLNNNGTTSGTHAGAVRYAGGWLTGTANLNNNAWHFVTLVDNAGIESIYVDGNLDAVTSTMGLPLASGANQLWIGGTPDGGDGAVKMNGLIDEVFMFNRALSQAEVQALYYNNNLSTNSGNVLPAATPVTVASGAALDLGGVSQSVASLTGVGVVTNSGSAATLTVSNSTGTTTFSGRLGDASLANALSLVQNGNATNIFTGANNYRGPTTVNGGALFVNGTLGGGAVTVNGGTLGGSGVMGGAVTVQSGGTLSPGGGIATLTVNNSVTLRPGSTTFLEINKSALANDQLVVNGALNYGGTLLVTNLAGTLAAGDSFPLFQAGSFNGVFSSNSLPPLNSGLAWNISSLSSGVLSVISTMPMNLLWSVNGTNLTLSWPADHTGWRLQSQTNDLTIGLGTNWFDVANATLTNSMTFPVDATSGSIFYRMVFP